jgi:hypothetical protein
MSFEKTSRIAVRLDSEFDAEQGVRRSAVVGAG